MTWMIYGAYGYTGRLTAERAVADGESPVLAGRRERPLRELAERLGLPWRAFGLNDEARLQKELEDMDLVLHCAGPFSATSRPMVQACLATGTHYLDITGEIPVFEAVARLDGKAKDAGVVLLPGAGFDVVPSDCLAAALAAKLPDATELELAFASAGGISPGTSKTMIEGLPLGGCVRRDGRLTPVPTAHSVKEIRFAKRTLTAVSIPWGDVSTAYSSTKIPNIIVYMAVPKTAIRGMKITRVFSKLLGAKGVQSFLKGQVDRWIKGPDAATRAAAKVHLWGLVRNKAGQTVEGTLEVCEGYTFTALASLAIAERVLAGDVAPGSWTPSAAFGSEFINAIPGSTLHVPRESHR